MSAAVEPDIAAETGSAEIGPKPVIVEVGLLYSALSDCTAQGLGTVAT
jgi:hypothetical protein